MLFIDIETVPQVSSIDQLPETSRKLFFDKIPKTMPENDDNEAYLCKAGIYAEFGKVICISTGYLLKDGEGKVCLKIKSIYGHDEVQLLHQFIAITDKFFLRNKNFVFAGHNIREFDIPFICRRLLINRIALPSYLNIYGAKPWEICLADTLQWWKFGDYKNYISLHLLASVLDVPTSKDDINGSMVQHVYYADGDLPRIVTYCEKDVIVVVRIVQRFKNLPLTSDEHIIRVQ